MIKALIVDDEVMFRIGVKSCINWNDHGYELIGEAADGKQALEIIKEQRPDIVFTDIKMPVMDGLELTRNITRDFAGIRVVILSCYNDFQYVKEALKLGAKDYILKLSMKPSDLVELLDKMRDAIEEEKRVWQQTCAIRQEFNTNIDKLKEELLKKAILEAYNITRGEFSLKVKSLGLKINYDNNRVMAIKVVDYARALESIKDETLFHFAFINMAGEIINRSLGGEVIQLWRGEFICIVNSTGSDEQENRIMLARIIRDINSSMRKYLNFSVYGGASGHTGQISDINMLYKEAVSAMDKGFYEGEGFFGFYSSGHENINSKINIGLEVESKLIDAVETANREEAFQILEQIFSGVTGRTASSDVRGAFKEILYILNRAVKRYGGSIFEYSDRDAAEEIDSLDTFKAMKAWMRDFLEFVLDYVRRLKDSSVRAEVMLVVDYIKSHMSRSISLKDAARIANMSEKYFCILFKKEMGKNFIDYVNDAKVERAKEFLKNRETKTYEVAQRLGFENEGYFSKIFKRYSGCTPQEYRRVYTSQ